jgi:hypothetical protein
VPRDYTLILVDKETNVRRVMRNTASYAFNSGANATRSFQIVAEPSRGAGRVRITQLDVTPNTAAGGRSVSSVSINYNVSLDAETRVIIRDGRGRTLRTIVSPTRVAGEAGALVWDLRDQNGTTLPSGVYNVELNAQTQDGQRDRRVQPFLLTR